jgi:hypothetical protein
LGKQFRQSKSENFGHNLLVTFKSVGIQRSKEVMQTLLNVTNLLGLDLLEALMAP